MRRADLRLLEAIATGYPSRARFHIGLTLDPPGTTSDEAASPDQSAAADCRCARRQAAGGKPVARLNARANAASES